MQPLGYLPEHTELGGHEYAIIDRVLFNQMPESINAIELVMPLLAPQARIYPWLLPLHEIDGVSWATLINEAKNATDPARQPKICLLLKSKLSPRDMKDSLINLLITKDEHQRGHILRFYDPRVLFHLQWMLTPWEFSNRFNTTEIQNWTFWLEGQWHSLEYTHQPFIIADNEKSSFDQIQRIGLINRVLTELPRVVDITERQALSQSIDNLLQQCPLDADTDKVIFAKHGIIHGEEFWKAQMITTLLKEAKRNPGYYSRLTLSWGETDWKKALNKT